MKALATLKKADQVETFPKLKRVVMLGIGNPLNRDDAVGCVIADRLVSRMKGITLCAWLELKVINSGPIPENFSGVLRRYAPNLIIMLDAAQLGEKPGFIRWIPLDEISGFSASTHGMPLTMLTTYLSGEINCEIALIGIQPGNTTPGLSEKPDLTPEVKKAAAHISRFLVEQCA